MACLDGCPQEKKCCCCVDLRKGCIIIAIVSVIYWAGILVLAYTQTKFLPKMVKDSLATHFGKGETTTEYKSIWDPDHKWNRDWEEKRRQFDREVEESRKLSFDERVKQTQMEHENTRKKWAEDDVKRQKEWDEDTKDALEVFFGWGSFIVNLIFVGAGIVLALFLLAGVQSNRRTLIGIWLFSEIILILVSFPWQLWFFYKTEKLALIVLVAFVLRIWWWFTVNSFYNELRRSQMSDGKVYQQGIDQTGVYYAPETTQQPGYYPPANPNPYEQQQGQIYPPNSYEQQPGQIYPPQTYPQPQVEPYSQPYTPVYPSPTIGQPYSSPHHAQGVGFADQPNYYKS